MFVLIAAGGLSMTASMEPIGRGSQDRQGSGRSVRRGAAGRRLRRVAQPHLRRRRPAVLRLAVGPDRPRTHHGPRVLIGAGALFTLSQIGGTNPAAFVLVTALYFGVYGEIFSLFPATQGDTFGSKYAAANAGMLYTAKGTGALLVPVAVGIAKAYGHGVGVLHLRDLQRRRRAARAVRAEADAGQALRETNESYPAAAARGGRDRAPT